MYMLRHYIQYDMRFTIAEYITSFINTEREYRTEEISNDELNAHIDLLMDAANHKRSNDPEKLKKITQIFLEKSFSYINELSLMYHKQTNRLIHVAIEEIFFEYDFVFKNIVKYSRCPALYVAEKIKESTKGLSTKTKYLDFLILISCEVNMTEVKYEYETAFGESLRSRLQKKLTRSHRRAIFELMGEKKYDDD